MSKRVLVTDDSILMRRIITEALLDDDWEIVAEAGNGDEAVALYQEHHPDVVTMDIVMPGCNGLDALTEIIQYDPNAMVVVVSALNQTKMISDAIRRGAQDFIAKPFLPEQIQDTLNECIREMDQAAREAAV